MSVTQNAPEQAGNIAKFAISSNFEDNAIDLSAGVVDYRYYESVLSNAVTATATVVETGFKGDEQGNTKTTQGTIDSLPIRGGERTDIIIEDTYGNELKLDDGLYVNRVRDVDPGTQTDLYFLDFASREYFANEQTRVTKRYEGNISQNIETILKDVLEVEGEPDVDDTAEPYNFMGNDKKPFYVCTWLASKSVPVEAGKVGGTAGYLFYETYDGFNFRSIDVLNQQKSKGNYIFTNTADLPKSGEYKGKILDYTLNRDIDLQSNLSIGLYSNRTLFFDFYAYNYKVRNFDVDQSGGAASKEGAGSKGKINTLGRDDIDSVPDEFRKPISRIMNRVLDVGSLPSGKNIDEELKTWKNTPYDPTYDATKTMVQSVMRYNQMFLVKINIMIAGDFSLRAGDVIHCEFPELTTDPNTPNNKKSGGLYMISSLCHNITPRETYTSLTLVRDTFGRKPF